MKASKLSCIVCAILLVTTLAGCKTTHTAGLPEENSSTAVSDTTSEITNQSNSTSCETSSTVKSKSSESNNTSTTSKTSVNINNSNPTVSSSPSLTSDKEDISSLLQGGMKLEPTTIINPERKPKYSKVYDGIKLSVYFDKDEYFAGDTIGIDIQATNVSDHTIVLTKNCGQFYFFELSILKTDNKSVKMPCTEDNVVAAANHEVILRPGDSISNKKAHKAESFIKLENGSKEKLPTGEYTASTSFVTVVEVDDGRPSDFKGHIMEFPILIK